MILHTVKRDVRIRAMYPGEDPKASGLYYVAEPNEIAVDGTLPAEEQAVVLLHEIIHAIWDERQMGARVCEESVCRHLSVAFAEVIRDNPAIIAALGLALTDGVPIFGASIH